MVCTYCSTPNPETNRFCGECGQPLVRQQVNVPAEFGGTPDHAHRKETTISGPSFLGLTDSSDDQTNYLFEDDQPPRSHTGWVVFSFIAIVVLAVVGWMEWNAIKTGQIELPWLKSSAGASSRSHNEPADNASASPAKSESSANTSDEKSQADSGADSGQMVSNESDAKPAASDSTKSDSAKQAATPGTNSSNGASDAEATRAAQSRIASDAADRRANANTDNDTDGDESATDAQGTTPEPRAKPVRATEAKADPRQDSMLVAGEKYLYGRGVRQDCNQALIYFKAAAEKENGPAMSHLGAMYASGHCVTQNKVAAYKWFSRASESEPGNQWISRSLNMLWRDMSPQERASIAR